MKLKQVFAAIAAMSISSAALAAVPQCPAPRAQPTTESVHVTARAIEWAQAQESAALRTVKPLSARLQAIAKGNGVKLPQNIRLVVVDEIPLPQELRHVAQYEACGGIPRFLGVHLADMLEHGYRDSRFEVDARAHERR